MAGATATGIAAGGGGGGGAALFRLLLFATPDAAHSGVGPSSSAAAAPAGDGVDCPRHAAHASQPLARGTAPGTADRATNCVAQPAPRACHCGARQGEGRRPRGGVLEDAL